MKILAIAGQDGSWKYLDMPFIERELCNVECLELVLNIRNKLEGWRLISFFVHEVPHLG